MAEIFSNEGLDLILAAFPKNGTNYATTYVGLFTSQTATTVPAATAVLATQTGVTECSFTNYARQSIAAASWGANAAGSPDGRQTTAGTVTFPATGGTPGAAINGFFIATTSGTGTGVAFCYCNFAEGAVTNQTGLVITVTPTIGFGA